MCVLHALNKEGETLDMASVSFTHKRGVQAERVDMRININAPRHGSELPRTPESANKRIAIGTRASASAILLQSAKTVCVQIRHEQSGATVEACYASIRCVEARCSTAARIAQQRMCTDCGRKIVAGFELASASSTFYVRESF